MFFHGIVWIGKDQVQVVIENRPCVFESDPVFCQIPPGFRWIPSEIHEPRISKRAGPLSLHRDEWGRATRVHPLWLERDAAGFVLERWEDHFFKER